MKTMTITVIMMIVMMRVVMKVMKKQDAEQISACILPNCNDDRTIRENIAVLISRVLVTHLKFFKVTFEDLTEWHINHPFQAELSTKSVVVS